MQNNLDAFIYAVGELKSHDTNFVIVTLTSVRGSSPQDIGARMLVTEKGLFFGTVGGGKIEAYCIEKSQALLVSGTRVLSESYNLQKDIGMTCGGEVGILYEVESCTTDWNIALFGAGHVAQKLSRVLIELNCKLFVIDNREEWLAKLPKHHRLTAIHNKNMQEEVKTLPENCFVASMTMGHSKDVPILLECLSKRNFPYLGVIGSKAKRNVMVKELMDMQLSSKQLESLICPIGLPIGKNDPGEIAISVAAQLLQARDQLFS